MDDTHDPQGHVDPPGVLEETPAPEVSLFSALGPVLERLDALERALFNMSTQMTDLSKRVDLIPPQIRQVGVKVDDMTASVSDPRLRDLLGNFLLLNDLIDQMIRSADQETQDVQAYRVLRNLIIQTLEINGLHLITEAEQFDPVIHKAIKTIPCNTEAENGEIVEVTRAGYRTERAVFRYAEVVVKRYQAS
jgi:hypothetical protein